MVVGSNPTVGFLTSWRTSCHFTVGLVEDFSVSPGSARLRTPHEKKPAYKKPAFFTHIKIPAVLKFILYAKGKPGLVLIIIDRLIHCYLVINPRSKSYILGQFKVRCDTEDRI